MLAEDNKATLQQDSFDATYLLGCRYDDEKIAGGVNTGALGSVVNRVDTT